LTPQVKIVKAITELDEQAAPELADEMIKTGTDPLQVLERCREGMYIVGERLEIAHREAHVDT